MHNKYGYIPTKEYPFACLDDDCGAQAYHLSTVNDHSISTISPSGMQKRRKTLNIRCRRGHTLQENRDYDINVFEGVR
jgi:hypothetical protein